jgi:hypothetical protein
MALGAGCVAILLCAATARADLPQRALVGNFIGYDALPENYFSISGSVDRTQMANRCISKKLSRPTRAFHSSPAISVSSRKARRPSDSVT